MYPARDTRPLNYAIVSTTIHQPTLLVDYCQNAKDHGHQDIAFFIIGDKKTPTGVDDLCHSLEQRFGFPIHYSNVSEQIRYLKKYPSLAAHLPYNSIQRRNIGLLQAYQSGADLIITIDDDNFIDGKYDYIGQHSIVGKKTPLTKVSSSTNWYNVCQLLEEEHGYPFYHRGFPLNKRWGKNTTTTSKITGQVVINAGLWLEDPDIDAITRFGPPIHATKYTGNSEGIALAHGTWSPFNSQNTAMSREIIPAYFLSPNIGRYDDIWASYIVKKIADHLQHYIHFGQPVVRQKRNTHNIFRDLDQERLGMELTDNFIDALIEMRLSSTTYQSCFNEIVDWLSLNQRDIFAAGYDKYSHQIELYIAGLTIWQQVHEKHPSYNYAT